jgi:hypothetical protein
MSIAPLVLFAALAAAPVAEPDPTVLVAKLGSAEPAERAKAAESLEALGREALPALQKAMNAGGTDVGKRASALWDTIQRDLMTRPSMVRMVAQNKPILDVLKDLETQAGMTLQMNERSREELVAFREPAPVSLWTALERLGLKGVYHQNPGNGKFPELDLRTEPLWAFTSTAGPFRVSLMGLHYTTTAS